MERKPIVIKDGRLMEIPTSDIVVGTLQYNRFSTVFAENYKIPSTVSSVVTGPFDNQGNLDVEGRLEII